MEIGVSLPVFLSRSRSAPADLPALARHAEDIGLDAVWSGDHLSTGAPNVDSTVTLSAAAAVTERIRIGFAVYLLALRHPAWAAKQLGSLQLLSGNRLVLGVGVGGEWPQEWAAAGVPMNERGRRTDAILDALPGLLAGEPTALPTEPGAPVVTLAPAVPVPPLWVGGMSARAKRRAVRVGARGWLGSMLTPGELAGHLDMLAAIAAEVGAGVPSAGVIVFTGGEPFVRYMTRTYGMSPDRAAELVASGEAGPLAERLREYTDAGAGTFIVATAGTDIRAEYDRVAEAKAALTG
ncbi:MAG TPA: LLM class flavin-dependent oxidoreductase [Actinophytocola sp.]|uniref:LLM class flavin-dependent oxidoreductase n=1 Tax=Actinophytocola sp. TaxID=1872138 RepID=UPI002DDD2A8F|nr:LLM class flavin-dependent oxidoreductase [Actinophytocola sp.]HEV2783531.1 LLM class flavin-dependent oxidoreductase [Actinophytocola sp.]